MFIDEYVEREKVCRNNFSKTSQQLRYANSRKPHELLLITVMQINAVNWY